MAGTIITDKIQTENSFLTLNVGQTLVATINSSGILNSSGGIMVGANGSVSNTAIAGVITGSQLASPLSLSGNLSVDSTGTTGIRAPSANTLALYTAGTEDMRISSTGIVSMGTTDVSNTTRLKLFSNVSTDRATSAQLTVERNNAVSDYEGICFNKGSARAAYILRVPNSDDITFGFDAGSSTSEALRIDSSGRLLSNKTTSADNNARIQSFSSPGNGNANFIASLAGGSGSTNANQTVGYMVGQTNLQVYGAWDGSGNARNAVYVMAVSQGVQLSSGGTSWSSISDERKKDIIEPITNAAEKVASLRAVIGKYKNEEDGIRRSFLIAQDVQAVLPEAVTVEDEGLDTEKLLLSYSDTIPLLVAAIKEQQAIIDDLKARIEALEA